MNRFKSHVTLIVVFGVLAVTGVFAAQTAYAEKPTEVTVTNTPLPVTVTNPTNSGANVTVTNPATNPVQTTDAFSRTPFRKLFVNETEYTVPTDSRLIIEALGGLVSCDESITVATMLLVINSASGAGADAFFMPLPVQLGRKVAGSSTAFYSTLSARIIANPGDIVSAQAQCNGVQVEDFNVRASGYLISVNSSSLAP